MASKRLRLQKYLSQCGVCSRRAAEELIVEGRVKVNDQVTRTLGVQIDPDIDRVQVGKRFVRPGPKGILLLHKPKGVMSTLIDPEGRPTIADYLTKHYKSYFPVGRLDWESTGLMVLTNDGELAERLLHPRYGFSRTYHVRVEGEIKDAVLRKLERGITLEDGRAKAKPIYLRGDGKSCWLQVTVNEGRNRLIRRMMQRVGHPVMKLRRIVHGPFKLGRLKPGQVRKLTEEEYAQVHRKVMGAELQGSKGVVKEESPRIEVEECSDE